MCSRHQVEFYKTNLGWLCSTLYRDPLYGPLHKFVSVNLIYTSFGEALGDFGAKHACLLCTHGLKIFRVHKTCEAHGNKGNKIFFY